jgi:hypothetical protein
MTVRVACAGQYWIVHVGSEGEMSGTYGGRLSACEQEVEALAGKTVHGLLLLGKSLGLHQIRKHSPVLGMIKSVLDVARDGDIHDIHDILDVLAHVVGQHRHVVGSLTGKGVVPHHVSAAEERLDPSGEVVLPPFLREESHGLAESVLRDDVGRKAVEGIFHVEGLPAGPA